jgi:hypothetical protein
MSNFIEDQNVFLPGNNKYQNKINQITPNTQVKMYLYDENHISWESLIYINDKSKAMIVILIWTAGLIVVLSLMILYLHRKEKKKDERFKIPKEMF